MIAVSFKKINLGWRQQAVSQVPSPLLVSREMDQSSMTGDGCLKGQTHSWQRAQIFRPFRGKKKLKRKEKTVMEQTGSGQWAF